MAEEDEAAAEAVVAVAAATDDSDSAESATDEPAVDEAAAAASTAVVTASAANLRSGPGSAYEVVAVVSNGDELTIVGQTNDCANLVVLTADGVEGWLSAMLVSTDVDCEDVEAVEAP